MAMETDTKAIACDLDDTGRHAAAFGTAIEVKPHFQPDRIARIKVFWVSAEKHTAKADVFRAGLLHTSVVLYEVYSEIELFTHNPSALACNRL
jgi:hypothetical protein